MVSSYGQVLDVISFSMNTTFINGLFDELEKIASTRMEREIQAGNIQRSQVVPGAINAPSGPLGAVGRKFARNKLMEPSPVPAQTLEMTRKKNQLLYKTQMKNPSLVSGSQGTKATNQMTLGGPKTVSGFGSQHIQAPEASGAFMRRAGEGIVGKASALASTAPQLGTPTRLLGSNPADVTNTQAVFRHEGGEAYHLANAKKGISPYASHLGVRPVLEEQMAARTDPDAVKILNKTRQIHPDDALVGKLIRQAGGTPDSPLPIGGRAEKRLNKMLDRNVHKLHPSTRQRALNIANAGVPVSYVPKEVSGIASSSFKQLNKLKGGIKGGNLSEALSAGKGLLQNIGNAYKFVRKGRL